MTYTLKFNTLHIIQDTHKPIFSWIRLIGVDSHSKWPHVMEIRQTTCTAYNPAGKCLLISAVRACCN